MKNLIKQSIFIELPVEEVIAKKKYIVVRPIKEHSELYTYTKIIDGQWQYSIPYKKKEISEIQFNYEPKYFKKLEVQYL